MHVRGYRLESHKLHAWVNFNLNLQSCLGSVKILSSFWRVLNNGMTWANPLSKITSIHKGIKTSFIICSSRGGENSINLKVCNAYQILFHVKLQYLLIIKIYYFILIVLASSC